MHRRTLKCGKREEQLETTEFEEKQWPDISCLPHEQNQGGSS